MNGKIFRIRVKTFLARQCTLAVHVLRFQFFVFLFFLVFPVNFFVLDHRAAVLAVSAEVATVAPANVPLFEDVRIFHGNDMFVHYFLYIHFSIGSSHMDVSSVRRRDENCRRMIC